jgi:glutamate-1-semialdehyde 2,1-aminomutase
LARANRTGETLMEGLRKLAGERGIPLLICGFGAAFAVHFTPRSELHHYRHILEDDRALLARFLFHALEEGIYILPDGRFYVSAVHSPEDVTETLAALRRALDAAMGGFPSGS